MLKWFRKVFGGETPEAAPADAAAAQAAVDAEPETTAEAIESAEPESAEAEPTIAATIDARDMTADAGEQVALPDADTEDDGELDDGAGAEIIEMPAAEAEESSEDDDDALPSARIEPVPTELAATEVAATESAIAVEPEAIEEAEAAPEPAARGFFTRLRDRLSRTTETLVGAVKSAIGLHGKVDEELLQEIEDILIQSDVGVPTTMKIVDRMRKEGRARGEMGAEALLALFKQCIEDILKEGNRPLHLNAARPMILLFVDVNGTGKTTTIGKLAQTLAGQGKLVMMVAADTFRAAAADQLQIWAERTGSCIVRQAENSDPAAVVFEALEGALAGPTPDVIMIDTAGRLHTKLNLMEQLKKIVRIIKRHYPDAPHETILVLDATTGQNAVNQVKIFHEACDLTGLIMTKLDGTAKGGILIACKDLYTLPIFKIGIGEQADDLRDFDAKEFAEALFGGK